MAPMPGEDNENVYYGTPLVREDEVVRKKGKVVSVEQGQGRQPPVWKQEVTDAEGRRRFHGAFTGGFSAGYYNTVGSKEGWTPSSFSSSRSQRAGKVEQQVYDFLDDDEKEELKSKELVPSAEYDALGSTASELSRRTVAKDGEIGPLAILVGGQDDILLPQAPSIGFQLLVKMGWRRGFDFKDDPNTFPPAVKSGAGLGVETLESDHGNQTEDHKDFKVLEEKENGRGTDGKREDCLPSFHLATDSSLTDEPRRFPPPVIPADFTSTHTSEAPVDVEQYISGAEPPEVASPDSQTSKNITGVAAFVARSGQRFEDILKQKHAMNPQFAFLFEGSSGHDFYVRKLWEEERNLSKLGKKPIHAPSKSHKGGLAGAQRGQILGERPLPTTEIQVVPSINSKEDFSPVPPSALSELTAQMNTRFTSGTSDTQLKHIQGHNQENFLNHFSTASDLSENLKREEKVWRPTALLCRRFNVQDPFLGKEPIPQKLRSGSESQMITAKFLGIDAEPSRPTLNQASTSTGNDWANEPIKEVLISENSVDLYKAIFSDDEDEDEDQRSLADGKPGSQVLDTKDLDAANAKRNYIAAGDFLESLGKELGLRV